MKTIFNYERRNGVTLTECYENGEFYFVHKSASDERKLTLYPINPEPEFVRTPYLGYTEEEVLSSGKDILARKLLEKGDPVYAEVKRAMPKLQNNVYCFLGGPASWAGVTVTTDGSVIHQASGRDREPAPIFKPTEADESLGATTPRLSLLGGEIPVLCAFFSDGEKSMELLYFVEPGDTDRDPVVWIRIKKYSNTSPMECEFSYRVAALNREGDEFLLRDNPPTEEIFLDALSDTVNFWVEFENEGTRIEIPEEELAKIARGAISFAALTFTGDHPHYGHRFYGKELHDNFPPNYIWGIECAIAHGRHEWAKGIFDHFMRYALNGEGRISYRQGTGLNFGVSAVEYAMMLDIAARYKSILELNTPTPVYLKKLKGMGDEILSHVTPCPEHGGLSLVKMCAEADTNERVNVYLNNNLWAIRGFSALDRLIKDTAYYDKKYALAKAMLEKNINEAIKRYSEENSRFGTLVPFRLGYTATPLTLSICKDTFYPESEEELKKYFTYVKSRGQVELKQDLRENTYANYRYYPEMLCSMLLTREQADAIVNMRESLGGELLCMTRFSGWIDNWPVLHYARFLIETGRIEKYLILMYAHAAHHGRADLMAYYEQIRINGTVKADDCVPSLLTVPAMLCWAFAYERINDGGLQLLSALPRDWYDKPFSAMGIGYSGGKIDIISDGETIDVTFENATKSPVDIVFRNKDELSDYAVTLGKEYIEKITKNRLTFKPGLTRVKLSAK